MAAATVAIAAFTAILGWSTNKLWLTGEAQAKVATRNATSTRRAATAAIQSNAIARENMQREQRPFVYVNKPSVVYTSLVDGMLSNTAQVMLVLRNHGQTPAKDVRLVAKAFIGGIWNESFETNFDDVAVVYLSDIPPHDQKQRDGYYFHGLLHEADEIRAGVRSVFVEGVINYRDAFGNKYVTAFRFASTEQEFDHSDWSDTPEGNSAD